MQEASHYEEVQVLQPTTASSAERKDVEELKTSDDDPPTITNLDERANKTQEIKHSSSQFFHFVRLMQLFPNVHPATLHSVMTLCKNDFFVAVDRLLYAKRCKEMYQSRKNMYAEYAQKTNRYTPYLPCGGGGGGDGNAGNCSFAPSMSFVRPQVVKLDTKKTITRGANHGHLQQQRSKDVVTGSNGRLQQLHQLQQQHMQKTPLTLQCSVPLRPLSPVIPEDLSSHAPHSHQPDEV